MANETEENVVTKEWLNLADGLDYSAKILIRYCLTQAAQTAIDKSRDWVKLAEAAGLEDDSELLVIRIITDESDLETAKDKDIRARKLLEDRIGRLEGFKKMADTLISHFREELIR